MPSLRLQPRTAITLGACLAACWAVVVSFARAHNWGPSSLGQGVFILVLSPLCASILLLQGGFNGRDSLGSEPRARGAGRLYVLAIIVGLGVFVLAIFLFVMSGMIGAFP